MKKLISVAIALVVAISLFAQPAVENNEEKTVTVYAYDTFCGDWGSSSTVIPLFEEKTGIKVNLVSAGSVGEMINKLLLEGDSTECDVVLGIPDELSEKVLPLLSSYDAPELKNIEDRLKFDDTNRLLPFDWGSFAFVWDTECGLDKPTSLEDLTKDEYKGKVILIDPRTSSVGLGLLLWTYNALGDDYIAWWKTMSKNALAIASGWSSAYGLFTEGEAPIVLSYTTSPVYHVMNENTTRYQALIFDEGHEVTIEGLGIMKNSKHREEAEAFVSFILSDAQENLAVTNSMYPSVSNTELPSAYEYAPVPEKIFKGSENLASSLLASWTEEITK